MPPPLCLGVSYDGATSTLLPPRVATTFSHAAPLVPSPGSRSTTIVLSKRSFLHLRGCLLCMPAPARLSCLLPPPPSPSPGLGLFLWCREPRREALASSRTSCSPMLQAGASFPEEALFGVQWRLLPGDNNLLVPLWPGCGKQPSTEEPKCKVPPRGGFPGCPRLSAGCLGTSCLFWAGWGPWQIKLVCKLGA